MKFPKITERRFQIEKYIIKLKSSLSFKYRNCFYVGDKTCWDSYIYSLHYLNDIKLELKKKCSNSKNDIKYCMNVNIKV